MRENITVSEAISKGKMKLVYLPMFILFSSIGLGFYLQYMQIFEGWIIAITVVAGFVLSWLAWSYFVVEWKIWAFENVRNVHELKRKAIEQKLIWNDDSWFNKTQIIRYDQKQKLKLLERKFLEKDVYKDDLNIPKETFIHYSKASLIFGIVIGLAFVIGGFYFFETNDQIIVVLLFGALGSYFFISSLLKLFSKSPRIILSSEGILLHKKELMKWEYITNEITEIRSSGKHTNYYLVFYYKNKQQEMQIDDLEIDNDKLENLLQVYRVRFEKNNPSQ
jgi:hypothetical protein